MTCSELPCVSEHRSQAVTLSLQGFTASIRVTPGHQKVQVMLIAIRGIGTGARSQRKSLQVRVGKLRSLKLHIDSHKLPEQIIGAYPVLSLAPLQTMQHLRRHH